VTVPSAVTAVEPLAHALVVAPKPSSARSSAGRTPVVVTAAHDTASLPVPLSPP
jgi:hypothetical protein